MGPGLLQVYTGNGKGKSTAAFGLAVRASGHGMRSFIAQFLKGRESGELRAVAGIPEITVEQFGGPKFVRPGDFGDRERQLAQAGLDRVREVLAEQSCSLLILDEVLGALGLELLSFSDLEGVLDEARRLGVEVVCTGRNAPEWLVERADLVSEVRAVKHYFDADVPAREGFEY